MSPALSGPAALELLAAERGATVSRLTSLRADLASIIAASAGSNADDEHDPEGATIAFERSQVAALVAQALSHLEELDAAVSRVADGSWGTCESCGHVIVDGRLRARPTARTCVTCS